MKAMATEKKDYYYGEDEIQERVKQNLKGHKQYQKLYEQYQRLDPRRDFVKCNLVQTQMR